MRTYHTASIVTLLVFGMFFAHIAHAEIIEGTTGEGAQYALAVPDNWNGVLIVYAHGIVVPTLPVALPGGFTALRNALMAQGLAVAYSSYSENGFAIKDGEQQTHRLLGLFKSRFGNPDRVYIAGHSLGAVIAMALAERYPTQYDGALPMCGFLGGSEIEIAYLGNLRVLFDALFPGVVPGGPFDVPPSISANPFPTLAAVQAQLIAGLGDGRTPKLFALADVQGISIPEKIQSVLTGIGFGLVYTTDLLSRTHGRIPFDNSLTIYGTPEDPINSVVARFASDPDAMNYIRHYETPTGSVEIPMVTLHTNRDPVAPHVLHQSAYAQIVAAAGNSARLRQRTVSAYGHCAFQAVQIFQALSELRAWVEQGVVPAP